MNNETELQQVMRVSCRQEGEWVVVTHRPPVGIQGEVIELARVRLKVLQEDRALWEAFQEWLRLLGASIIRNALGLECVIEVESAPPCERAGNA